MTRSCLRLALCLSACLGAAHAAARLAVSADGTGFEFDGKRVFLSGANQPWLNYGSDFGNNQTNGVACALQEAVANVSAAGGNTVRMWLFVEGDSIPQLDAATGRAVAPDAAGSLVADMRKYARFAASRNVFIVFCLWNGAVLRNNVSRISARHECPPPYSPSSSPLYCSTTSTAVCSRALCFLLLLLRSPVLLLSSPPPPRRSRSG